MKYLSRQVVFREVPNEISLSYLVTGCQLACLGCHSSDAWYAARGFDLTVAALQRDLEKFSPWITCVLFMGGEWESDQLISLLQHVRRQNLATALYTGLEDVPEAIKSYLDYIKTGPYKKDLGGLNSHKTNQRLLDLRTGEVLNKYFLKTTEGPHDSAR